MKWRVVKAAVSGAHSLDLTFNDGTRKQVDLLPLLEGPVFERLRDPVFFARVVLDPVLEPSFLSVEADQYARRLTVPGDDNVLLLGLAQKTR